MFENQKQSSGDNSVNIQAEKLVLGATYGEIRQIAQDIFDANFYRLANTAADIAKNRSKDFTEKFLAQLAEQKPNAAGNAHDPDFQYCLFTAQMAYARTGDEDLSKVLIDLLVDRAAEENRSLRQIVLNEAIATAHKLTSPQWDALTMIFLVRRVSFQNLGNLPKMSETLKGFYVPFISNLPKNAASYEHLVYAGCATINEISTVSLENAWQQTYPGLFSKGFGQDEFVQKVGEFQTYGKLTIPCLRDASKLQLKALNDEVLRKLIIDSGFPDKCEAAISLQAAHLMGHPEIKTYLMSIDPEIGKLFDTWDSTPMKNMSLTSVGIAIAHANLRRKTKETVDLGIWIKEQ